MRWILIVALAAIGCSSDATNNGVDGGGGDGGGTTPDMQSNADDGTKADIGNGGVDSGSGSDMSADMAGSDAAQPDMGADAGGPDGTLPSVPTSHGVAYVGHLEDNDLRWFRTDGVALEMEGAVDAGSPILSLALDRENDLLAATHPFANEVSIWQLSSPQDVAAPVTAPAELARLSFDNNVLVTQIDPFGQKLYAAKQLPLPGNGGPQTEMVMYVYDISDPSSPAELTSLNVPASVSWDIDPVRKVLFIAQGATEQLHGYDIADEAFESLGTPIEFETWYPEQNMSGFQARNMTIDPFTNRIYLARAQGLFSELIAITYPPAIPTQGASYRQFATMGDLSKLEDAFDLAVAQDARPDILSAYQPMIDPQLDMVFMSAAAWNGMASVAIMVNYRAGNIGELAEGCGDHADAFGCFYRRYSMGMPSSYAFTDGAGCVDYTNRVVIGTSVDNADPTTPGAVFAYSYDENGGLQPFNDADGSTINTDAYPVAAACH